MKTYNVEICFSGHIVIEVEAENELEAQDKAEVALNEMDEREIVANINDVVSNGCEEVR